MKKLQELVKKCRIKVLNGGKCPIISKIEVEYKNKFKIPHYYSQYDNKMSGTAGKEIANIYEALDHNPNNELVVAAYKQLAKEALQQFSFLQKEIPIQFEPFELTGEPYKNSFELLMDIHNYHMYFFKTENGFGETTESTDSIMLAKTGLFTGDYELLVNDVFRIIHDIFGHAMYGHGFGPVGEDLAWWIHSQMFTPLARAAITIETRGQNCWVNFGPHLRKSDGTLYKKGEKGWLSPPERPFAEQKMNLMPAKVSGIKVFRENNSIKAIPLENWDPFLSISS